MFAYFVYLFVCFYLQNLKVILEMKLFFSYFPHFSLSSSSQKWDSWVKGSFGFFMAFGAVLSERSGHPCHCAHLGAGAWHRELGVPVLVPLGGVLPSIPCLFLFNTCWISDELVMGNRSVHM